MKSVGVLALVLGALLMTKPAAAQMYDPRYPVCMHVYGNLVGERMDCVFTSLPQCQATASGISATCIINPYYAPQPRRGSRYAR